MIHKSGKKYVNHLFALQYFPFVANRNRHFISFIT